MPHSDRAFRALGRSEPGTVIEVVRALVPGLLPADAKVVVDDLAATQLDAVPPPTDTDFVARVGEDALLHMEAQGYGDDGILDRLFGYHLGHVLRHRRRRVETVALWLMRPPPRQRRGIIRRDNVIVRVRPVVVPEIPAAHLLSSPQTACFAPAADPGNLSVRALCTMTAQVMARGRATWVQRHMAVIAAAMHGRYEEMVKAMEEANLEPVIIEDLVKFGIDRGRAVGREEGRAAGREEGRAAGREEGREEGQAGAIVVVLRSRGLEVSDAAAARILATRDADLLSRWLARVAIVESTAALLAGDD